MNKCDHKKIQVRLTWTSSGSHKCCSSNNYLDPVVFCPKCEIHAHTDFNKGLTKEDFIKILERVGK